MVKRLLVWLAGSGLIVSAGVTAATFTAEVDRQQMSIDEHLTLTLRLINSDVRLRAEGVDPNIDLSVLTADFDLGRPQSSHRFNIDRGRGRSTSEINVELFPKRAGTLTIPSFNVAELHTEPLAVTVIALPGSALPPEVFVRTGPELGKLWVDEQTVVFLDIFHRVQLQSASLGGDVETEPVLVDTVKLPQTQRREVIEGLDYEVERVGWAIQPTVTGRLTIYLPDVWIVTETGRKVRLPHQVQTVDVQPLPAGVPPGTIVGQIEIIANEFPSRARVDELVPWSITLRARSTPNSLPEALPDAVYPEGLRVYPSRAQRQGVATPEGNFSEAVYTLTLVPRMAGTYTLPALSIPYFDTQAGTLAHLELAAPTLVVAAALARPTVSQSTSADHVPSERPEIALAAQRPFVWQTIAGLFAVLWLGTLWWWRRSSNRGSRPPAARQQPKALSHDDPLKAALLAAFGARTLEQGLQEWQKAGNDDADVTRTVEAVARLCYGRDRPDIDRASLKTAVKRVVRRIRAGRTSKTSAPDPWSPRAFTSIRRINLD